MLNGLPVASAPPKDTVLDIQSPRAKSTAETSNSAFNSIHLLVNKIICKLKPLKFTQKLQYSYNLTILSSLLNMDTAAIINFPNCYLIMRSMAMLEDLVASGPYRLRYPRLPPRISAAG